MFLTLDGRAAHGHHDARPDIVAEDHCAQELRSVNAELLRSRQRRGDHGDAGMRERRGVCVVGFVGMSQHAIDERRFDRAAKNVGADDRGDFFATVAFCKLERRLAGHEFRTGNHGRKCVEDVVLGFFCDFVRQRAIARFAHVGTEPSHHRADGIRSQRRYARKSRSRDRLQPARCNKPRRLRYRPSFGAGTCEVRSRCIPGFPPCFR